MPFSSASNRFVLVTAVLALAGVAAAQRFVWPPAAGDRAARDESALSGPAAQVALSGPEASELPATGDESGDPLQMIPVASPPAAPVAPLLRGAPEVKWQILENPNGPHAALFFDPVRQVFAVYHVDAASGEIMLKSVRNLGADLRLPHYNSSNPAPKDIQAMLDEAR